MTDYAAGAVKQDPVTKAVAIRSTVPSSDGSKDWGVMTTADGGHYASSADVQAWTDLPGTPVPDPAPAPQEASA